MKLKKIISMGLLLSVAVLVFAGCGKKETDAPSETMDAEETQETVRPEIIDGQYGIINVISGFSNGRAWVTYSADGVNYLAMIDTDGKIIYQTRDGSIESFCTLNSNGKNYGVYLKSGTSELYFVDPDGKETKKSYDSVRFMGIGEDYLLVDVFNEATGEDGLEKLDVSGENVTPGKQIDLDSDYMFYNMGDDIFYCDSGNPQTYKNGFYNADENAFLSNPDGYYKPIGDFSDGETFAYFESLASLRNQEQNDMHGKVQLYRITTDMLQESTGQLKADSEPVTMETEKLDNVYFDGGIISIADTGRFSENHTYYDEKGNKVSWTDKYRSWDFWKDAVMSDNDNNNTDEKEIEKDFEEQKDRCLSFGKFDGGYATIQLVWNGATYYTLTDPEGENLFDPVRINDQSAFNTGDYIQGWDGQEYDIILPDGTKCKVGEDDLSALGDRKVSFGWPEEWDQPDEFREEKVSLPYISGGYIFMDNPDETNTIIIRSTDNSKEIRGIDLTDNTEQSGQQKLTDNTKVTRDKALTEAEVDIEQEHDHIQDPNGQFSQFPAKTLCDENGFSVRLVAADAQNFWLWIRNNNPDNKSARFRMDNISINGFCASVPSDTIEAAPGESKVIAEKFYADSYWQIIDALNEPACKTPMEKISLLYSYGVGKDSEEVQKSAEILSDNYSEEALAQLYGNKVSDLSWAGQNFTAYQMDSKIGAIVYFQNNGDEIFQGFQAHATIKGESASNAITLPDNTFENLAYLLPGNGKVLLVDQSAQETRIQHEIPDSSPVELQAFFRSSVSDEYWKEYEKEHEGELFVSVPETLDAPSVTVKFAE